MLERYQILLEDWQAEHLKLLAKLNDFSLSEMTRVVICSGILHTSPTIFPELKSHIIGEKELLKLAEEGCNRNTRQERRHALTSKLYFETRKATEHMDHKLKEMFKTE